jgi:quercetin dioxygenase-like cupin family protein
MRIFRFGLVALIFAALGGAAYAANALSIVTPQQLKWSTEGVPKGISWALVTGNPDSNGMYVQRIKMNPGAVFPPHTHGKTEVVTVLSGTLWAGIGSKVDQSKMKPLPAGTVVVMPANMPHYVMAKDTVVLDVSGMGPFTTKMLSGQNMKM